MNLRGEFEKVLREFMDATVGDVVGCILAKTDGLMIASVLPTGMNGERVAALGATVAGMAEKLCKNLDQGETIRIMVEGSKSSLLANPVGGNMLLIVLTSESPNLGLILLEMERVAERVKNIIEKRLRSIISPQNSRTSWQNSSR